MKPVYVSTANTRNFMNAFGALEKRGASEACMMVLDGEPGLGKSRVVQWWAVQNGCPYLRAKQKWTPPWLLRELLQSLNITPEYSFESMFRQSLSALGNLHLMAERKKEPFGVVIDEVDYFSRQQIMLETVRDLSDMLELPFILVGMGRVGDNLKRFPQVKSRVGQHVKFQPESLDDTAKLVSAICEAQVGDDLVKFTHMHSGGYFREIKEAIAAIERFASRHSGKVIDCAAMEGQLLFNDRKTGKPVIVRV